MTYRPLFKPQVGEIIPPDWYWDVVDNITYLYIKTQNLQGQLDCVEAYLKQTNTILTNIYNILIEDIYPTLSKSIYNTLLGIRSDLSRIEGGINTSNYYLRLISPASRIKSISKTVTTVPEPLFVDQLTIRRAKIKASRTNIYLVYLGGADSQDFVLEPGEEIDLNVRSPIEIYLKSNGEAKVFAIFEVVE